MRSTGKEKLWLVKSGDRIVGPFLTSDVIQRLKAKELVIIDEIASSRSRWNYIRDVSAFHEVVEEIRQSQMHSREDTEVQGYTETKTVADAAEKTQVSQSGIQEAEFVDMPRVERAPLTLSPNVKTYGVAGEQPLLPPPAKLRNPFTRPGFWIGIVVLVVAVGFAVYTQLTASNAGSPHPTATGSGQEASQIQRQADRAWQRGEFDHAAELFKRVEQSEPGRPEVAVRLAPLMVRFESQTLEAKRLLAAATPKAADDKMKEQIELGLGQIAINTGDLSEARGHLNAAGSSWMAAFNLGVVEMTAKNWSAASAAFLKAGDEPMALVSLAQSQIAEGGQSNEQRQAIEANLAKVIDRNGDFKQEALIVRAAFNAKIGNSQGATESARLAIETDPELTAEHFHDPVLVVEHLSWESLLASCHAVDDRIGPPLGRSLLALCLAKASQLDEATKVLESQLSKTPGDPSANAVSAYVHMLAGRDDAARAALKVASKQNSELAQILGARICTKDHDDQCAEDKWSRLASEVTPPLASLTGLARVRFTKGDREAAAALLIKADSMSPRYLPLLRLREETSR